MEYASSLGFLGVMIAISWQALCNISKRIHVPGPLLTIERAIRWLRSAGFLIGMLAADLPETIRDRWPKAKEKALAER